MIRFCLSIKSRTLNVWYIYTYIGLISIIYHTLSVWEMGDHFPAPKDLVYNFPLRSSLSMVRQLPRSRLHEISVYKQVLNNKNPLRTPTSTALEKICFGKLLEPFVQALSASTDTLEPRKSFSENCHRPFFVEGQKGETRDTCSTNKGLRK